MSKLYQLEPLNVLYTDIQIKYMQMMLVLQSIAVIV